MEGVGVKEGEGIKAYRSRTRRAHDGPSSLCGDERDGGSNVCKRNRGLFSPELPPQWRSYRLLGRFDMMCRFQEVRDVDVQAFFEKAPIGRPRFSGVCLMSFLLEEDGTLVFCMLDSASMG